MKAKSWIALSAATLGLLLASAEAYSGDLYINHSGRSCQATQGGTCVQHGDTYVRETRVERAGNVCQSNRGGSCQQGRRYGQSYGSYEQYPYRYSQR